MENTQQIPSTEGLSFEKVWLMFQETRLQFQETDKKFQETDKRFKETEKLIKNLTIKMSESESRWGKFVESLVEGDLVKLLNKRGIKVKYLATRTQLFYNGREYEFDIIAENGDEIVIIEVKTTLKTNDINEFLEELKDIKNIFPRYQNKTIYGAVAYIQADSDTNIFAYKNGLFVIKATGSSASITNDKKFVPKIW